MVYIRILYIMSYILINKITAAATFFNPPRVFLLRTLFFLQRTSAEESAVDRAESSAVKNGETSILFLYKKIQINKQKTRKILGTAEQEAQQERYFEYIR